MHREPDNPQAFSCTHFALVEEITLLKVLEFVDALASAY